MRRAGTRDLPLAALLCAIVALAVFVHGYVSLGEARRRLDVLLARLGETALESAAVAVRAGLAVRAELERELERELRAKAALLAQPGTERIRDAGARLERFASAAGLKHLLLFDADGRLVEAVRGIPSPAGGGLVDPGRLRLDLESAARELAAEARGRVVVRALSAPAAGLKNSLAVAAPLPGGATAVLVRDTEAFARVRAAAGADASARRLESETALEYVRFEQPAPTTPGSDVLALERRVELPGGGRGTLRIGLARGPAREALAIQRRGAILCGIALVASTAAAMWGLLRLRRARERLQARLQRDERLTSLGRLAAGIAHEVRNPLNAIGIAVQRVQREAGEATGIARLAGIVAEEVDRLDRTVENVLRYARPREPRRVEVSSRDLLGQVDALARPVADRRRVRLRVHAPADLRLFVDSDLIKGAVWNLLRNALHVAPEGTDVDVEVSRRGGTVRIEVRDRGPGVPAARRDRIFEPFASDSPGGSGLGLPLALSAAESHGGTIEVEDGAAGGAVFRILLPGAEAPA